MANKPKNPISGPGKGGRAVAAANAVRDAKKQYAQRMENNTRKPLPKKMTGPSTTMSKGATRRGK